MWIFQVAAFTVATITYKKHKNTKQKYFIYFLGFVLVVELLGYLIPQLFKIKNQFIYNIFTIVSFSFYLYWFNLILKRKRLINIGYILFAISIFFSIFFEDFFKDLWKISLTTGTVLVLFFSVFFYYDLLKRNEVFYYQKSQNFWIVTGLLIFYIAFLPIQLLQPYLDVKSINYRIIITILNIILYGIFTISFLCTKKR